MTAWRAPALAGGTILGAYIAIRELGSRGLPTYAMQARNDDGSIEPVVVERLALREGSEDAAAALVRAGKRLMTVNHPNLVRIRDVDVRSDEVLVVSELVDAERLDVVAAAARRPIDLVVLLRVLVDVLGGLSALHLLRDQTDQPNDLFHGEVCPANVLLGIDGNARLAHLCRIPGLRSAPEAIGYVAPEVRVGDPADARADVYSCGVMLWEMLAGERLFPEETDLKILPRQVSDNLEVPPTPADQGWAGPLAEVVMRALAADPAKRQPSTADLAAEVRKVAGAKLALKSSLASLVKSIAGERIADRRHELTAGVASTPMRRSMPTPAAEIPREVLERAMAGDEETTAVRAEARARATSDLEPTEKLAKGSITDEIFARALVESGARKIPTADDGTAPERKGSEANMAPAKPSGAPTAKIASKAPPTAKAAPRPPAVVPLPPSAIVEPSANAVVAAQASAPGPSARAAAPAPLPPGPELEIPAPIRRPSAGVPPKIGAAKEDSDYDDEPTKLAPRRNTSGAAPKLPALLPEPPPTLAPPPSDDPSAKAAGFKIPEPPPSAPMSLLEAVPVEPAEPKIELAISRPAHELRRIRSPVPERLAQDMAGDVPSAEAGEASPERLKKLVFGIVGLMLLLIVAAVVRTLMRAHADDATPKIAPPVTSPAAAPTETATPPPPAAVDTATSPTPAASPPPTTTPPPATAAPAATTAPPTAPAKPPPPARPRPKGAYDPLGI